jgi:CBS domain-containing protein
MKFLSIITDGEAYNSELSGPIYLHPDQLVLEAAEIMLQHGQEALPVYENNLCVGILYLRELMWFLIRNNKDTDLFVHSLGLNLRSAVKIIRTDL